MGRKVLWGLAIAFVVFWIWSSPRHAGASVTGALHWLRHAGHSLGVFLNHVRF